MSEVYDKILVFATVFKLTTKITNIEDQKIDDSSLKMYGIVLVRFFLQDSIERVWFFKETFLLAKTSIKVVLEILFLTLSHVNVKFYAKKLTWKKYIITETIPPVKLVELIDNHKFVKTVLDKAPETFVVYVAALEIPISIITIHPTRKPLLRVLE